MMDWVRRYCSVLAILAFTQLLHADPTIGRLSLNSTQESQIYLDGAPMGKTPKEKLKVSPGNHQVRLKKPGGNEYQFEISVQAGKHVRCNYNFDKGQMECGGESSTSSANKKNKKGYLKLSSDPPADVYVDGKMIGKSPIEKYEVAPGHYIVEFRYPNYEAYTKDVEVLEDQTVIVEASFAPSKPTE